MEQFETPDILRSVESTRRHPSSSTTPQSTPRLHNSEPNPLPTNNRDLSDSILSLRFPRPVGNRQLTNWISSSSPDIMQPGNITDDDPSLSELGYDVIGTDGESQAESTTSSLDYQKPDDVQSLMSTDTGTDVDTDSSDDEENTMHETTTSDATVVQEPHYDEADETETLNLVNRSLESPTNLSLSGLGSPFTSSSYLDHIRTHDPAAVLRDQSSTAESPSLVEHDAWNAPMTVKELEHSEPCSRELTRRLGVFQLVMKYFYEKRRVFALLSGLGLVYTLALVGKSLFFSSSMPKELSTVPVASVSIVVPSSVSKATYPVATSTSTLSQTPNESETSGSPNSLIFVPFAKDNAEADVSAVPLSETVCSAEVFGRDEILLTMPHNLKFSWLARDAILIAVSRGLEDIPTKVSSVDQGFLIQVPSKQAHGVLVVTIATTNKPRIHESFHVNFGSHRFTEALDVGKQLVQDIAQIVANTVNERTTWVDGSYIPALDIISKQLSDYTESVSGVLRGVRNVSLEAALAVHRLVVTQLQSIAQLRLDIIIQSVAKLRLDMARRATQLRLEVARQAENVFDELHMGLLRSRVASKLMWLQMKGKSEERAQYISKAKDYWQDQLARFESARVERAERTKRQIQACRERDQGQRVSRKDSFWSMAMGL